MLYVGELYDDGCGGVSTGGGRGNESSAIVDGEPSWNDPGEEKRDVLEGEAPSSALGVNWVRRGVRKPSGSGVEEREGECLRAGEARETVTKSGVEGSSEADRESIIELMANSRSTSPVLSLGGTSSQTFGEELEPEIDEPDEVDEQRDGSDPPVVSSKTRLESKSSPDGRVGRGALGGEKAGRDVEADFLRRVTMIGRAGSSASSSSVVCEGNEAADGRGGVTKAGART